MPDSSSDRLLVRHAGQPVGCLTRDRDQPGAVSFEYDAGWIAGRDSFAISHTMLLRPDPVAPAVAYPWFLNLLPEGDPLAEVSRRLGLEQADLFGLLAELGGEVAGALEILPEQSAADEVEPQYDWLDDAQLAEIVASLPERPLMAGDGVRMSLAGVQDKLPIRLRPDGTIGLPLGGAPSSHILKPGVRRLHGSVENEAFCLTLAGDAGLAVAPCRLRRIGDRPVLLVRRYDRPQQGDQIRRLHQEDFCQAAGLPPSRKYERNGPAGRGLSAAQCFGLVDAAATVPATERLKLLDALVFNVLVNNVDAHAKNYSLLIRPGAVTLAPLYDLMCGAVYKRITRRLAMAIGGEENGSQVRGRHWTRLAEAARLSAPFVLRRVKELAVRIWDLAPKTAERIVLQGGEPTALPPVVEQVEARCRRVIANLVE